MFCSETTKLNDYKVHYLCATSYKLHPVSSGCCQIRFELSDASSRVGILQCS